MLFAPKAGAEISSPFKGHFYTPQVEKQSRHTLDVFVRNGASDVENTADTPTGH